jgi:hypothetical protein
MNDAQEEVAALNPFDYDTQQTKFQPRAFPLDLSPLGTLIMEAHIWPPRSTSKNYKLDRAVGRQGFYFYRNDRLLQAGGWNDLRADTEPHLSLARVMIDLPPQFDAYFSLDVQKASIKAPPSFLTTLKAAVDNQKSGFGAYLREAERAYRKRLILVSRQSASASNVGTKPPRVLISYSHDSEEHKQRVLALTRRLRGEGIDCRLDRFVRDPPEGWPKWMEREVEAADKVLVVCTETYHRRFKGNEEAGVGLGVQWEASLIRQILYEAGAVNTRFIPVIFKQEDALFVPISLRGGGEIPSPRGLQSAVCTAARPLCGGDAASWLASATASPPSHSSGFLRICRQSRALVEPTQRGLGGTDPSAPGALCPEGGTGH